MKGFSGTIAGLADDAEMNLDDSLLLTLISQNASSSVPEQNATAVAVSKGDQAWFGTSDYAGTSSTSGIVGTLDAVRDEMLPESLEEILPYLNLGNSGS